MKPAFDPSKMTRTERHKIAKRAKRNVGSEVTLILTAGTSVLLILLFWFGNFSFLPLAELLDMRPPVVWLGLAVTIAFMLGSVHGWLASSAVALAQKQQFEIHQFDEANRRAETEEKLRVFKNTPAR